jgi:copper chaperone CopZ
MAVMKKLISGSLLAAAVSFGLLAADKPPGAAGLKTETIKVSGWHCADCAAKTETALNEVKGVKSVSADKAKKEVRVTYDDRKVKRADLEKAIADSGFAAEK